MEAHWLFVILQFCSIIPFSVQYRFGLNWGFCEYLCSNEPKREDPKSAKASGYYWKDYNGVMPEDAFMATKTKDGKNVYVGLVYDPKNNGMDIVPLFEGQTEITYSNRVRSTLTKNIQVLCSEDPEKFKFVTVTSENWTSVQPFTVKSGHTVFEFWGQTFRSHLWISIDPATGSIQSLVASDHGAATATGQGAGRTEYVLLAFNYNPNEAAQASEADKKEKGFFSHSAQIERVKGSLVPNFNVHVKVGSCYTTCTSETDKTDPMYYWRGINDDKKKQRLKADALVVGHHDNTPLYLMQGFTFGQNILFTSANESFIATYALEGTADYKYIDDQQQKVFSTASPEALKWVPVNASTVNNYKAQAVIGGGQPDGTTTYVGRYTEPSGNNQVLPGIVFMDGNPRMVVEYSKTTASSETEFELLIYTGKKPSSARIGLMDVFLSFFQFSLIV